VVGWMGWGKEKTEKDVEFSCQVNFVDIEEIADNVERIRTTIRSPPNIT